MKCIVYKVREHHDQQIFQKRIEMHLRILDDVLVLRIEHILFRIFITSEYSEYGGTVVNTNINFYAHKKS